MIRRADGSAEIRGALAESRRLFVSIGVFSAFVNLLMLTGPLFMLQVYDRVLASRSEATLVALVAIVAFLFLAMGLLDHARARVLVRAGGRFQARMDSRVLGALLTRAGRSPAARSAPATGLQDLEAMQRFASGPTPFAFFDAPWTPVFLFALFAFHWMLGVLAVSSGVLLLALALLNQARTSRLQDEAGAASAQAAHFLEQIRAGGETVRGLGMRAPALARSRALRNRALAKTVAASDRGGAFAVSSRTLRLFLQSMMLGLGAWLAIHAEVTPGTIIAASILLGRALAPIDQAVGQWPVLQRALRARRSLADLLSATPEEPARTALPVPEARLQAENVVVTAPGAEVAAVRGVTLRLEPGSAVGIAGPSASGKSTLARALAGVWQPLAGKVTLGGAALDQYGEEALARHIGWLPQDVVLFEGSVAENIARLEPEPDAGAVVEAARCAGAHEMILSLPGGYDFQVAAGGAALSGGQRQRIALATRRPLVLGFVVLALLACGLFGWGAVASISGAVIATGRVEVETRDQVVEHIDGGTVEEILVREGDRVEAGQVLIRFDDSLLRSDEARLDAEHAGLVARRNRLDAEFRDAQRIAWDEGLTRLAARDAAVRETLDGQQRLFDARRAARAGRKARLRERIEQTRRQIAGLEAHAVEVERERGFVDRELGPRRTLFAKGMIPLDRLLALEREAARLEGKAAEIDSRLAGARGRIAEIDVELQQIDTQRLEEAESRAREVHVREMQVRERLAAVRRRLSRLEVRAPVAGEVFAMAVFAKREVVQPGEPILRIVPEDAGLVVLARLDPIHVDQVWRGQDAVLRFTAFPARATPEFEGRIRRVSADAVRDGRSGLSWYEVEV